MKLATPGTGQRALSAISVLLWLLLFLAGTIIVTLTVLPVYLLKGAETTGSYVLCLMEDLPGKLRDFVRGERQAVERKNPQQ